MLLNNALFPTAVLKLPAVLEFNVFSPIAVLLVPEVIEATEIQPKDEESKIMHEDNKSKEGGLFPTDEENDEDDDAE